jgi:hypothetical protein
MNKTLQLLMTGIRYNCHISNARHAGSYTLCVYLLKMREYYRWEQDQPLNSPVDKNELGQWLAEREEFWESLQKKDFVQLQINNQSFDPFDSHGINQQLLPYGMVYSAGYGNRLNPHFFLGDLESFHQQGDYVIYITGKEYARDLTAPPAMAQGNTIFLRRESFRRMIWEKYEEWLWNKPDNAMKRALQFYPFGSQNEQALDAMTENELRMALFHEIGEVKATELLGEQWLELLSTLPRSKAEIMFRAVKDHLADSLSTFPQLMNDFKPQSLHFYIANLTSMRKILSPRLIFLYELWLKEGFKDQPLAGFQEYVETAKAHWLQLAREMIDLKEQYPDIKSYTKQLVLLVERSYL